jgi:hypothetical protein
MKASNLIWLVIHLKSPEFYRKFKQEHNIGHRKALIDGSLPCGLYSTSSVTVYAITVHSSAGIFKDVFCSAIY